MHKLILFLFLVIFSQSTYSQTIKFKKNIVYIDGNACLYYQMSNGTVVELRTLDGTQTIFLKYIRPIKGSNESMYNEIEFYNEGKRMTSQSYIYTKKLLVKALINDYVLQDCTIKTEYIDRFIAKNHQEVIIRYRR